METPTNANTAIPALSNVGVWRIGYIPNSSGRARYLLRSGLTFSHFFGSVPKPKSRNRKNEQGNAHNRGVNDLNLAVRGIEIPIQNGAIVNVFDEVAISFVNMQYFSCGTVELYAPKVILENEFYRAFFFPDINAVNNG